MTREQQLSLAIARHLEPEPKWTPHSARSWHIPEDFISDGRYWRETWHAGIKTGEEPRSITEPEVFVKLVKALSEKASVTLGQYQGILQGDGKFFCGRFDLPFEFGSTLELAVAEAFVKCFRVRLEGE